MLKKVFATFCMALLLVSCGFHLQGILPLAEPLKRLCLQTPDSYGYLARNLEQYLRMSGVVLVTDPKLASATLQVTADDNSQKLISISSTQQTRQYNLIVTVNFQINDQQGRVILPTQILTEARTITVQSSQILGSSNEANMFYQQMRRNLAYAIMNRIASKEVTQVVNNAYQHQDKT